MEKRYWRALSVYASAIVFCKYIWKCFPTLAIITYIGLKDGPKQLEIFGLFFGVGADQNENQIDFFLFICHTDVFIVAIIYVFDKEALTWRNFHPREEISNAGIFNVFIGFAIPYVC